jgi:FdhD protein
VVEFKGATRLQREDRLGTEEPLEIRLEWPAAPPIRAGVTMRTPGHDFELAAGWLVHEGVIAASQLRGLRYCTDVDLDPEEEFNVVTAALESAPLRMPDGRSISSACGVCGKESISDALSLVAGRPASLVVPVAVLRGLPTLLREAQGGFEQTGGLHAAGLFTAAGERIVVREDVGRHNAVDKVVGSRLLAGLEIPPVLVLSGRIGFELVQKAVVSGISVVVAVGAPSSLAVRLGAEAGLTIIGFTRPDRCVVYAGDERVGS